MSTGGPLINGDRRRKPFDEIDTWLLEAAEKLTRVTRKGFNETSLAVLVNRLEAQARLSGAANTGKNGESATRDLEIDVFEIVLRGPSYGDGPHNQV